MNRGLILRGLRETWPTTLLFALALLFVEGVLAFALPTIQKQLPMQMLNMKFMQNLVQAMLGSDLSGPIGPEIITSICWVHPVVLAIVWAHAVVMCTRIPSGEVDRGTIDILLALPVSRWGLYLSETLVWLASGAVVLLAGLLGNTIGASLTPPELHARLGRLFIVLCSLYSMYIAVGGMAWLMSCLSDRRGRAMTTVFVIVLASFLINYLAQFWEPAKHLSFLSVLTYHRPLTILRDGSWPLKDMATLAGAGSALWIAAGVIFSRRDLTTV